MKFKLFLTMLFAAIFASTASAAIFSIEVTSAANTMTTQVGTGLGIYSQDTTVTPGPGITTVTQFRITARSDDGTTPLPLQRLVSLTDTLSSNTVGPVVLDAASLPAVFNDETTSPTFRAYNRFGVDVTAGLIGQSVLNNDNLSLWDVYEIRGSNIQTAQFTGTTYQISQEGDVQTHKFDTSGRVVGDATVESATDTATITATVVPEPTAGALAFATLGFMTMFRRRK